MGYTTEFEGAIDIVPPLDADEDRCDACGEHVCEDCGGCFGAECEGRLCTCCGIPEPRWQQALDDGGAS